MHSFLPKVNPLLGLVQPFWSRMINPLYIFLSAFHYLTLFFTSTASTLLKIEVRARTTSGVKSYYTNGKCKGFSGKWLSFQWFQLALLTNDIKWKTASKVSTAAFSHYINAEGDRKSICKQLLCYHANVLVASEIMHKLCSLHNNVICSSVYRSLTVFLTRKLQIF